MCKHPFILYSAFLLSWSCIAGAQSYNDSDREDGSYAAVTFGNGVGYGAGSTGDKSMKWRTFEVRFGKELEISSIQDAHLRWDVVHYNEGHPDNNHRDGFSTQLVARKKLNQTFSAEAGVGPYYSMNTTMISGTEYDDPRLGALVSLALMTNLDRLAPGLQLRFAVNHVTMPGAQSSKAFMVGVGKDFDPVYSRGRSDSADDSVWYSVMAGNTKTNHGGTNGAVGYSAEAKKIYGSQWAASVAALHEGDDGVRVDRNGVAVQGWFIQPLNDKWTASAGVGPYVANNHRDSRGTEVDALITIQVERSVGKNWKVFASFNRVASFGRNNDRDLGRIGIMRKFK